jgi:hypothetical protein
VSSYSAHFRMILLNHVNERCPLCMFNSGSTVDSSFGEINSPGLYPRTYTSDMMLTTSSRPADDGRPAQKRARPEAMTHLNSDVGNKASSSRVAASALQKRVCLIHSFALLVVIQETSL